MKRALIYCTATVACLMLFVCSSGAAEPITTIREVRALFEEELFDMAYTVHTDKGRYAEALKVAEKAVKALPADRARSAEPVGQPYRALANMLYPAELGDGTARQSSLRLSRSMNEFPVRRYLREGMLLAGDVDPAVQNEYMTVNNTMGDSSEAVDKPASKLTPDNRELLLKEQARLAELAGKPAETVNSLNKLALIRPLNPGETTRPQESAALPEARRSFIWKDSSRRQTERRFFLIEPPVVGALVRYEIYQDERTVSGHKYIDSSRTVTERLDLATKGFAYHPALLQFSLKFSPEFRQNMESSSGIIGDASAHGNSFSPNYQADAVLLAQKPYTLTLFAQQLEAQSWATYTGVTQTTTDNYRADLTLKNSLLPTTIGVSTSKSEQAGYYATGSDWQEAHLMSRHRGITGDSSLASTYSVNKQVTNGVKNEIKTLNNTFSNLFQVTDDNSVNLSSNLQQMSQDSLNFKNTSLFIGENLSWQHRRNLSSQYSLNYRQFETGTTASYWSSLAGRLTHKLYENLTTTVGGTGTLNNYSGGEEKALTTLLDFAYQRRLANWGTVSLNAGANYLYTTRSGIKGTAQISNEPHILNSLTETFLDKSGISTDSVVVTNSVGTIIYVKDIDYRIDLIASSVRISRLPLGAIADGQLVLVSYSYTRDAGFDDSVLTQNYGIALELKRSLFLSYRYLKAQQTVLAGPPPERLSDAVIHLAAIRYVAGWSETGGTIEDNDSSSDISYRRWELTEAIRLQSSNRLQYNLRGYYGKTDYRSYDDLKKTYGAITNLNWTPFRWLQFDMEGYLEQVDGTLEKTTNRGAKAAIGMDYRLWTLRLSHKLSEQNDRISNYKRRDQVMQLEISRTMW